MSEIPIVDVLFDAWMFQRLEKERLQKLVDELVLEMNALKVDE